MLFKGLEGFYRKFISLKTTLLFLGILIFFYLLGTLFPQGKEYAQGGGTFLRIVKYLDLLNIFRSPLFLFLSVLFFFHLGLCSFNRVQRLWPRRSAAGLKLAKGQLSSKSRAVVLNVGSLPPMGVINNIFKQLGFRTAGQTHENEITVIEKGLSPHWLSLIYHIALFICFIGFFITYLFAYEGEITLYPHQRQRIPEPSSNSRWATVLTELGLDSGKGISMRAKGWELALEKFSTEYIQLAKTNYPKNFLSRIALAAGLPGKEPIYFADSNPSYFPRDWKSHLILYNDGRQAKEKTIEVNDPLSYMGVTFYQMAFQQELKLLVEENEPKRGKRKIISVKSGEKFQPTSLSGFFKTGTLRLGTLYKIDGGQEEIVPTVELYYLGQNPIKEPVRIDNLILNNPLFYQNFSLTMKGYSESSILSFRYDPGRSWLWLGSISLLLLMTLRIWGGWYRIVYWLEKKSDRYYLHYVYKSIGLGADETRFFNRLKHYLSKIDTIG